MRACIGLIATLALFGLFAGCHSGGGDTTQADSGSSEVPPSATTRPIPPDSIFAKVKMGEERDQVYTDIGTPSLAGTPYQTGKAFIPFHYGGGDDMRFQAHYKGVGTITFGNDSSYTSGWSVVDVTYDPSEPGY